MGDYSFDYDLFIAEFPAFSNATIYPEATLAMYWTIATYYIANKNFGVLCGDKRAYALNLLTAHIADLWTKINGGQTVGVITSATIDKISVTVQPPLLKSAFSYWLYETPYGAALMALLRVKSVGGFFIGGSAPGLGFRKPWGGF